MDIHKEIMNSSDSSDEEDNFTITELYSKTSALHRSKFEQKELPIVKHNLDHAKRILCFNVLNKGFCDYHEKCAYAHGLNDQNVDLYRKQAYDMIKNDSDLSKVDLVSNRGVLHNLNQLTKLCRACVKGVCPGGYNCKHGAKDSRYQICYNDLNDGDCDRNCGKVHLTKKGLIPYNIQKMKTNNSSYVYRFIKKDNINLDKGPIYATLPTIYINPNFIPRKGIILKKNDTKQIIKIIENDDYSSSSDSDTEGLNFFLRRIKEKEVLFKF